MFSSVVFAALFIGLLLATLLLWAMLLGVGLRWAKVKDFATRQVMVVTTGVVLLQFGLNILFLSIPTSSDSQYAALVLFLPVVDAVVACAIIRTVFRIGLRQAFQAWLPTLLSHVTIIAFAVLVLRPFLYLTATIPTNAMAPTLVGRHWKGVCIQCGQASYSSPRDEPYEVAEALTMICDDFHVTQGKLVDKTVHSGDHILAAKFLKPRRWDLIVFQYPQNPKVLYVKRLIGMPGETIQIRDGSVWVNDIRQTPPNSCSGVEYLEEVPDWYGSELWGSEERPAVLADDEYFVLGDFSVQSSDSRFWQIGAVGHNPFAVPHSYIQGVVTHTFWPVERWRIHR